MYKYTQKPLQTDGYLIAQTTSGCDLRCILARHRKGEKASASFSLFKVYHYKIHPNL